MNEAACLPYINGLISILEKLALSSLIIFHRLQLALQYLVKEMDDYDISYCLIAFNLQTLTSLSFDLPLSFTDYAF